MAIDIDETETDLLCLFTPKAKIKGVPYSFYVLRFLEDGKEKFILPGCRENSIVSASYLKRRGTLKHRAR